jgi:hypothetical protein
LSEMRANKSRPIGADREAVTENSPGLSPELSCTQIALKVAAERSMWGHVIGI